jgi:hypothetical protein
MATGCTAAIYTSGMDDVLLLLFRGCVGGSFVVAFALLSEMLGPKSFAGVFGAAPSIAHTCSRCR